MGRVSSKNSLEELREAQCPSRVLLFSGGLDSYAAWHLLSRPPCLYIRTGHKYENSELLAIEELREHEPELDIRIVNRLRLGDTEKPDGHIPCRNLLFAAIGLAESASVSSLYLVALKGESSRDKTRAFARATSRALSEYAGRRVTLHLPFRGYTKTRLIRSYIRHGGSLAQLLRTHSCYSSAAVPCGRCMACFRRWVAMYSNGVEEEYNSHPSEFWAEIANIDNVRSHAGSVKWASVIGVAANNAEAALAVRRYRRERE